MQEQAASSRPSSSERSSSSAHHMDMEVKEGKLPLSLLLYHRLAVLVHRFSSWVSARAAELSLFSLESLLSFRFLFMQTMASRQTVETSAKILDGLLSA